MLFPQKEQEHNNAHLSQGRKFAVSTCWQKTVNTSLAKEDSVVIFYLKLLLYKTFKDQTSLENWNITNIVIELFGIRKNV